MQTRKVADKDQIANKCPKRTSAEKRRKRKGMDHNIPFSRKKSMKSRVGKNSAKGKDQSFHTPFSRTKMKPKKNKVEKNSAKGKGWSYHTPS
jgi:hypothetical protein